MSSDKYCCVPGCRESGSMHQVLHGFPNPVKDKQRFDTWLFSIGNCDVIRLENEFIYKYRRVCHSHFEGKYLCRYNKISNIAVPTLNMPASFSRKRSTSDNKTPLQQILDQPSTSPDPLIDCEYSPLTSMNIEKDVIQKDNIEQKERAIESMCLACLAGDTRTQAIEDKQLLETYQKLANIQLDPEDKKRITLCYFCYSELRRCHKFSNLVHRSDRFLQDLLRDGCEISPSKINTLDLKTTRNMLSTSVVVCLSIDDPPAENDIVNTSPQTSQENNVCMYNDPIKDEVKDEIVTQDVLFLVKKPDEQNSKEEQKLKSKESPNLFLHCDKCGKKFNKLSNYKKHIKTHTDQFPCTLCSKIFSYKGHLKRHMSSHTQSYICDRCSKKIKLKSAFEAHMRTHTGEKPFTCEACGKTFKQKSHLKTHIRTHSDSKPFPCETCGKSFRQHAQLISHMRTHTGERPFACNRCDMTFGHLTTLRKHRRLHIEVRPFPCSSCPVSFSKESGLAGHMRVHTSERPHTCQSCDKCFLEVRHLKEHMRSVHSMERPYTCNGCGKAYKRTEHLKHHMRLAKCGTVSDQSNTLQTETNI